MCDCSLYVDAHILGQLEFVAPVSNDQDTIQLFAELDRILKKREENVVA
jgi:hypothetical protein